MIVAGFGFRSGANARSLAAAYARAGGGAEALATAADKAKTPVFRELAETLGLPVIALPAEPLSTQPTPTRSTAALAERGTGSLAEAAALVAAGPGARLRGLRVISPDRMATCAIATGDP
ncbi:cobalamin biosynthesis protein [Alloyangia pacifica]|uniref:cobalamin biosynthesis protein n=1 Tax=Alloyangia pacifica TaxID=311180 RepID=UPI001CD45E6D|nr:cobalamin biosynthesis protein [Alloyangia pacifica]MCA0994996.1 cobalamin biosynthesis protein [Alloyangia pacifica]